MFDHRIQDDEQLVHARHQRDFFGLSLREQPVIEGPDNGIPLRRDQRGHLQSRPDHRAATPDRALAAQGAAIAVVGRHPDEGGQLLGRQGPQFRQLGQYGAAEARSDAGHALQPGVLFAPHGTVTNRGVELGLHLAQLTGQPVECAPGSARAQTSGRCSVGSSRR
jgi:hypothetical protein